ncbi:MAG: NADP-dependent malic enzyme [Alphaproteobacteria bacterium]|jgi:malate dehydrogenase (oxaloacetate-decarboxylating)|nr:NADP-dependent malic enzyme [Alphaproteobacteria bacterium]
MAANDREADARAAAVELALERHAACKGKIQVMPKCPIHGLADFAVWYTPGVAAPCRDIQATPERIYDHTNKGNSIAIVTDGSRVLGLGDIGPAAGLPVMEGKALLFKYLGDVDAVSICLGTKDEDEIVAITQALEPAFGAINLEDIAQPKCFHVLDRLKETLGIPVWHDDQQGTATVVLAAVRNALQLTGRRIEATRFALVGVGAANVAVYRLLTAAGADPRRIVACDSQGVLHPGRDDIHRDSDYFYDKWRICTESNGTHVTGGIAEALKGADVCLAFSRSEAGLIRQEWVAGMAENAVVFACANPEPEIWPADARAAGARIVATGRSDFPNQVNNSLTFPGIFRGVLDARARQISEAMTMAAAEALARHAEASGLSDDAIVPTMDDASVAADVAAATAVAAQREGLSDSTSSGPEFRTRALARIEGVRRATGLLMAEGLIPTPAAREG